MPERVIAPYLGSNKIVFKVAFTKESGCLGMQPEVGSKLYLKLNTDGRPIANKYREGKMERTLKRE